MALCYDSAAMTTQWSIDLLAVVVNTSRSCLRARITLGIFDKILILSGHSSKDQKKCFNKVDSTRPTTLSFQRGSGGAIEGSQSTGRHLQPNASL